MCSNWMIKDLSDSLLLYCRDLYPLVHKQRPRNCKFSWTYCTFLGVYEVQLLWVHILGSDASVRKLLIIFKNSDLIFKKMKKIRQNHSTKDLLRKLWLHMGCFCFYKWFNFLCTIKIFALFEHGENCICRRDFYTEIYDIFGEKRSLKSSWKCFHLC